ncbi:MAG: cupin domain-containing protein [Saprospiraceae bacterium]
MTPTKASRTFVNPLIKDKATFLETSAETGGKFTLIQIELGPNGGNGLHYHKTFDETFTVQEGILGVEVDKQILHLKEGESATVQMGQLHRFFNPSATEKVVFNVLIEPGNSNFEKVIQIVYGLAADGRTTSSSVPKNMYHMALIVQWGDTNAPGFFTVIVPILKWLAKRAISKGIDRELLDKYVKI